MLPKDVLKYAVKVDNIDEAVLAELRKKEEREARADRQSKDISSPYYQPRLLGVPAPGAIIPTRDLRTMEQQSAAIQLQAYYQAKQAQQAQQRIQAVPEVFLRSHVNSVFGIDFIDPGGSGGR
jgi:hypothetical protein